MTCLLALAACAQDAPDDPAPPSRPEESAPTRTEQMPSAVLGTYDTDAEACAETTTMARLVVSPDTLAFYYGYATVDAVDARGGGYEVDATLYQLEGVPEVVPEATTYRLQPTGDGVRLGSDYGGTSALVRCSPSGAAAESASRRGVRSEYTEIASCERIETSDEGDGYVERCSGYQGVPLYVSRDDLRYDVDVGVRNATWETPGGFNGLGETVEWRLRDDRPFAAIVRYRVEGPGGTPAERRSDLAVLTVGRADAPGCLVGYVSADAAPDQNTAARRLADREAAAFECAS